MFNTDQIDMVSRGISSNSRCDTIRGIGGITGTVITGGSGPLIDKSLEHSQSLVHNQLGAGVSCILSVVPLQCVHYCTLLIALSGVQLGDQLLSIVEIAQCSVLTVLVYGGLCSLQDVECH